MFAKIIGIVTSIIVLICSILGITLGKTDNSEMIQYNRNKTSLSIVLEENGSTGFRWNQTVSQDGVIELTEDKNISHADKNITGVPTTRVFTFKPVAEGKTVLSFSYERSWENEPIRVVKISVEVNSDMTINAELISDTAK